MVEDSLVKVHPSLHLPNSFLRKIPEAEKGPTSNRWWADNREHRSLKEQIVAAPPLVERGVLRLLFGARAPK